MNKKKIFILFLICGFIFFFATFFLRQQERIPVQLAQNILKEMQEAQILPSPTPFEFQEMTIPYLRTRSYQSQLSELEKVSEAGTYTNYKASYDSDGLTVYGQLTVPKASNNQPKPAEGWPAIIFIHGYIPPTLYTTFGRYMDYVNYLARNGFVVFKIDLRGHGDSEGDPGGAYNSPDYIIDTLNAYAALQSFNEVNPEAIGLWGHSMAGNVVFRSVVAHQNIPAVVVWAGAGYTYQDLRDFGIDDNSYRPPTTNTNVQQRRQRLRDTYGEFDPNHFFWKQVTPVNYLDGVETAIEIHHAVDDAVVTIDYSRNLMDVLQSSTMPHQLFEYSSGGHNLSGGTFSTAMQRTVDFFKEQLK